MILHKYQAPKRATFRAIIVVIIVCVCTLGTEKPAACLFVHAAAPCIDLLAGSLWLSS